MASSHSTHLSPVVSPSPAPVSQQAPEAMQIQRIMPKFHEVNSVEDASRESIEKIWLDMVLSLTEKDVGFDESLEKYKSILILLAHEIFYQRIEWKKSHPDFLKAIEEEKVEKDSQETLPNKILKGILCFDFDKVEAIVELKSVDSANANGACFHQSHEFQKFSEAYFTFYEKMAKLYENVLATTERFKEFHEKVFSQLKDLKETSPFKFVDLFIFELYLQQERNLSIQEALSAKLYSYYLPEANAFYRQIKAGVETSIAELSQLKRKDESSKRKAGFAQGLPPSLQQILERAYDHLHACFSSEQENVHDPVSDAKDMLGSIIFVGDEMPLHLFPNGAPGDLSKSGPDVQALVEIGECSKKYEDLFKGLSKEPVNQGERSNAEQKGDDRAVAIEIFNTELAKLAAIPDSIKHIASLVTVAKPYIDRCDHPWVKAASDYVYGPKETDTWGVCFAKAQKKGFEILEAEVTTQQEDARPLLLEWQHQFLFTQKAVSLDPPRLLNGFGLFNKAPEPVTIDSLLQKLNVLNTVKLAG